MSQIWSIGLDYYVSQLASSTLKDLGVATCSSRITLFYTYPLQSAKCGIPANRQIIYVETGE